MIDLEVRYYLAQMQDGEFEDPDGDKEAKVIQTLRIASEPLDIEELCAAITLGGSWAAVPTLIARFQMAKSEQMQVEFFQALWGVRSRMGWNEETLETFFDTRFWQMKWVGSPNRFISFIMVLSGTDFQDQIKTEQLASAVANEMGFSFAPFTTFHEFKICATGWDPTNDLAEVLAEIRQTKGLDQLFAELSLPKEFSSQFKDSLIEMRNDYLINRLKLSWNFEHYHTLLGRAICLNVT